MSLQTLETSGIIQLKTTDSRHPIKISHQEMNETASDGDDPNGDGEGVWSPDIEYYFHEALKLFPQCGRRKTILQGEGGGKMYGRNELIAHHIFSKTGKIRTRKQVSSHIQVLARRKAKIEATSNGGGSTAGSVSPASSMEIGGEPCAGSRTSRLDSATSLDSASSQQLQNMSISHLQTQPMPGQIGCFQFDNWNDRPIVTQKIRLVEFSAFVEHRRMSQTNSVQRKLISPSQHVSASINGLTTLASAAVANPASLCLERQVQVESQYGHLDGANQHHYEVAATGSASSVAITPSSLHPLASNHYLPAQFNRADKYHNHQPISTQQASNNNQQHFPYDQHHQASANPPAVTVPINFSEVHSQAYQQQQLQSSTGFTRHSYVSIDYRRPISMHATKLERIDISQIQDKFPEIGGANGLFQLGSPDAFFLVKFWADLDNNYEHNIEDQNSYYGFSSHFETVQRYKNITCSTKACSYGHQVVEKVDKIHGSINNENGLVSYHLNRSPMCEFMTQFIKKLRQLPRASQMNSVLENFTVLQVVTDDSTSEILLCLAYIFEIASPEQNRNGSHYHVYKLKRG